MSIRRVTAGLAALTVALVVPITMAAPAQAGVNPSFITLAKDGSGVCGASTGSIIGNPGSRFTVHNVDCAATNGFVVVGPVTGAKPVLESNTSLRNDRSATFTLGSSSGELFVQAFAAGTFRIAVTVTDTPIDEPKAHDEFQQVGVPASGDCADVAPDTGHYPGYPIGGWSKSWAQWINDGTGGPVCTREVEQRPDGEIVLIG